jgi:molybdate transport system ATP-binding protein
MNPPVLKLRFIKRFPGFELRVDSTFEDGITAVFGATGSGKSTLLNCAAGMCVPDEGEIVLAGRPIYSSADNVVVSPEQRRVGYVFQDPLLFPHLTVQGNIEYGFKLTAPEQRRITPKQLIDLLDLEPVLHRNPRSLSGGEGQRVALARALAASPTLLLLDEPLASLDMGFRGRILRYLKVLHQELAIPMVYVSHSISEVMAIAQRVLVLSRGQQVVFDEPRKVLLESHVQEIVETGNLENLLDVEVVECHEESDTMVTRLGDKELLVPYSHSIKNKFQQGDVISLAIRAGDIIVSADMPGRISARNVLKIQIVGVHLVKNRVLVYANCGTQLVVEVTREAASNLNLREGQDAYLVIKSNSIMVLG